MDEKELKDIVESLIFVSEKPVTISSIKFVLGKEGAGFDIEKIIKEIEANYHNRKSPIELRYIAGGWQFSSRKEFSPWVKKMFKDRATLRLSNSALETLSIIAYKQPMSRSEIEEIRGVEASGVLETLLERKLVKIVGRKETLGRPLLYGTTQEFLKHFGLTHLSELPSLDELPAQENIEQLTETPDQNQQELELSPGEVKTATEPEQQPEPQIEPDKVN
jgi:segregation and condensation protein B